MDDNKKPEKREDDKGKNKLRTKKTLLPLNNEEDFNVIIETQSLNVPKEAFFAGLSSLDDLFIKRNANDDSEKASLQDIRNKLQDVFVGLPKITEIESFDNVTKQVNDLAESVKKIIDMVDTLNLPEGTSIEIESGEII